MQDQCDVIKKQAEMQHKINVKLQKKTINQTIRNKRNFLRINRKVKKDLEVDGMGAIRTMNDMVSYEEFTDMINEYYENKVKK